MMSTFVYKVVVSICRLCLCYRNEHSTSLVIFYILFSWMVYSKSHLYAHSWVVSDLGAIHTLLSVAK